MLEQMIGEVRDLMALAVTERAREHLRRRAAEEANAKIRAEPKPNGNGHAPEATDAEALSRACRELAAMRRQRDEAVEAYQKTAEQAVLLSAFLDEMNRALAGALQGQPELQQDGSIWARAAACIGRLKATRTLVGTKLEIRVAAPAGCDPDEVAAAITDKLADALDGLPA